MRQTIIDNLARRLAFYAALVDEAADDAFGAELDVPRNRTLGQHLWCIVGTRESYAKAIADGAMGGWSSSVKTLQRDEFRAKLASSRAALLDAIEGVADWTPERDALLAEVAEHEVMHEGQIIRLMFGLEKPVPESCSWAVCG